MLLVGETWIKPTVVWAVHINGVAPQKVLKEQGARLQIVKF